MVGKKVRFVRDNLDIVGILDGRRAYKGPFLVQMDLTNQCNNNCIACWCNSPLLLDKRIPPSVSRQTLTYEAVKAFLDDAYSLGTRQIYMAGGGEPFMHPRLLDIVEYIKRLGMVVYINTNFTLVNERVVYRLIDMGVDHLTVSVWAGSPEVYSTTHPNKTEATFHQIRDMLTLLNGEKMGPPYIKIYHVISKLNWFEVEAMVELARETGSESVEFTVVDTMPGYTDAILFDEFQRVELFERCKEIKRREEARPAEDRVILFRFDQFLRRISSADALTGQYDRNIINSLPCYIGWVFCRIMPNGDVNSCLKSHRVPVGNIYDKPFREIWAGAGQEEFRRKTMVYVKDDPYFSLIGNDPNAKVGCFKSCDDLGRNQHMHERVGNLTTTERLLLKGAGLALRGWGEYVR